MSENMRRLHPRGATNRGICVDANGAMLGPDCILVHRTAQGFRCVDRGEAAALQDALLAEGLESDWLFGQCRRIAKALDAGETALAQIFGLRIPVDDLDRGKLKRLATAAPFIRANFNPDEPRVPAGQAGGGEWTAGSGAAEPALIPAQATITLDPPVGSTLRIPSNPTEITPIPFDFPGAERKSPPLPTNPFPRDPECAEEWAAAYEYCDKMQEQRKFRRGYDGPGKDYRSCLLGRVSERCGGNAI